MELSMVIPDNDCVRLLSQFVEEMDLTDLYATYSRTRENQADPRQMLKIVLYAYLDGHYSSREMEKACRRDINYMYLLEGMPVPDHATFARFRSLHFATCAKELLAQTSELLYQLGELSGHDIFIDGTKIEACANKYTFVWKKSVTMNQKILLEKLAALTEECIGTYGLKPLWHGEVRKKDVAKLRRRLVRIKNEEGISFVHGKGSHKTQLQRHIETLDAYLDRLKGYERRIRICGERNSYSKTDHDATFMRMKEDAMLNGQLKPAYNLQHGVDSEYVTWISITPYPNDTKTLEPFIEDMYGHISLRYKNIVADAGYESEENYSYLSSHGMAAFIKPANYEISKKRKYRNDISRRENMAYNADGDYYTCRAGKRLCACDVHSRKNRNGYTATKTIYECRECTGCPYRGECIKGRNWKIPEEERTKRFEVSRRLAAQRAESLARITNPEGCMLRINRSIQAEGSFADVKQDRGFRRFMSRGRTNVFAESTLLAISHNIEKLHNKIQSGTTGRHLFCTEAAA